VRATLTELFKLANLLQELERQEEQGRRWAEEDPRTERRIKALNFLRRLEKAVKAKTSVQYAFFKPDLYCVGG